MGLRFSADPDPSPALRREIADSEPYNPFATPEYLEARRTLGEQPWILRLTDAGRLRVACAAFLRSGRLNRSFEITSVPPVPAASPFWTELLALCRQRHISRLTLLSASSSPVSLPALPGEVWRRGRAEYLLDLRTDALKQLATNHQRNLRKAEAAGVRLRRTRDDAACTDHVRLVLASIRRRRSRGEEAPPGEEVHVSRAYTRTGSGELFQALLDETLLSSILVLRARSGAYYQSAGTSPEGMTHGASHFLVVATARALRDDGIERFNLGGAGEEAAGLHRFKHGFGTTVVPLESAEFFLGSSWRRRLTHMASGLSEDAWGTVRGLFYRSDRYVAYVADPSRVPAPEERPGIRIVKLSDADVLGLRQPADELAITADRMQRLGFNDAYGVICDGVLAHVSWLVTADHDRRAAVRNVQLEDGEAEITHCVTRSAFRGRGLYPYAIRSLCRIAAEAGLQRIFMITDVANAPSRRGIEKAGLTVSGEIVRTYVPWAGPRWGWTRRRHRRHPVEVADASRRPR